MAGQTANSLVGGEETAVLRLEDVGVRRHTTDQLILDGVDWTVHPGEHWALLEPTARARPPCCGCSAR